MQRLVLYSVRAFLVLAVLTGVSCGSDPSSPMGGVIPTGRWRIDTLAQGGGERHVAELRLLNQDTALVYDTLFANLGGAWTVRATTERIVLLDATGDGYHRGVEVSLVNSIPVDSVPRYWYFTARGDSLRYYRGVKFTGANVGLYGSWRLSNADSLLMRGYLDLAFTTDTIRIDNASTIPIASGHYHYSLHGNTLLISGGSFGFGGDRFEVVPGASLYITGPLSGTFHRVR